MAVIAAAAPATSIVFLSAELMWESWAKSDPSAPPAILIDQAGTAETISRRVGALA